MNRSRWTILGGITISLASLIWIVSLLDWEEFFSALLKVQPWGVMAVGGLTIISISLRTLRWNLISGLPIHYYFQFWKSENLGHLGNLIFPAKAGEFVRIAAICRLCRIPAGHAIVSVITDRLADGVMLGVFILLVIETHGSRALGNQALLFNFGVFGIATAAITLFIFKGKKWQIKVDQLSIHLPSFLRSRIPQWYAQGVMGVQSLLKLRRLLFIVFLDIAVFTIDYSTIWIMMLAFNWTLPFMAAVTVGVFTAVGIALPSAPGNVGVYQIACVLALRFYGVDMSSAVAFSIVLQILSFMIIGVLGGSVVLFGLKFSDLRSAQ